MPLTNNKVADDGSAGAGVEAKTPEEGKAMVDCLVKVVACHRHLASCMGGTTDSPKLRQELRQTRERGLELTLSCRQHLTARLRDKGLAEAERKDAELLWVAFSSSLELLHADMCRVFNMGNSYFSLANTCALVQTGMQGDTKEVAARALSLPDLQYEEKTQTDSVERQELTQLEEEIAHVDRTIEDMELKVNVLRWTVEARGPQYGELVSTDSASIALMDGDEERGGAGGAGEQNRTPVVLALCGVGVVAVVISVCVVFFA